MSRLAAFAGESFDVAIVGGGIIGCGIARDAALRGLRVALFEQRDFGSGTTAASTRIVHGGLRYLEMFDFKLVRMDLRERETLLRIASHLVKPLEFFIPFYDTGAFQRIRLKLGLRLYDALSYDRSVPGYRVLSAAEARRTDPALDRPGLRGAAAYHDARVDSPERLSVENIVEAVEEGARVCNYAEVIGAVRSGGAVAGVRVRDVLDRSEVEVRARVVVNATGPWLEPVARGLTGQLPGRIRATKGVHIVCPAVNERALVLFSQVDRRLLFAIQRLGQTWIGTTDTDFDGSPSEARATRADVDYLMASVRDMFPSLSVQDVRYTTVGIRALVRQPGTESSVSRMHKIVDGETTGAPGLVSVLGGKITGYRAIAEDATDVVCRRLRVPCRSTTATTPLPGARPHTGVSVEADPRWAHLAPLYGSRDREVIALAHVEPDLARALSPAYPDIGAQVVHAVRNEYCVRLSDFIRRRSLLGATPDQGLAAAGPAAALMARELGWSPQRTTAEVEEYRQDVEKTRAFRGT